MSNGAPSGKFILFCLMVKNRQDNYKTVKENTLYLSVKTAKKSRQPTGYKDTYAIGRQTVKKYVS